MKNRISRRHFIKSQMAVVLAAGAFPSIIPSSVLGGADAPSANGRVAVGCIGVGPQGSGVMGNFLAQNNCRVVAVCDVNRRHLENARNQVNQKYQDQGCQTYHQFEELLARKDIDAVLIATPDHWHVPVAMAAGRAGKDMYLEKPMGLSVEEDQKLRKLLQSKQRIFQFGTQQRSSSQFRQACELVRNGRIGELKQINVWCQASRPGGSSRQAPAPEGIDYDRWLGPAPLTPHTENKCIDGPNGWKTWWYNYDYALGFIAGWGVHPLDIAYWGHPDMMEGPMKITGQAIIPTEGACNTSIAWDVNFTFADGVKMQYRGTRNGYDQVNEMNHFAAWEKKYGRFADHGTAFEGTQGWVLVDRGAIRTSPENLVEEKIGENGIQLIKSSNHARNFLDSVLSRKPSICPIEDSVQADILCHVSDIATRVKEELTWNPARERFVDNRMANRMLAIRSNRKPWAKW